MNIDENDISKKSQLLTMFLCIIFGRLGVHRFYVGKYISGLIYFAVGCTTIILDILGIGYAIYGQIIIFILLALDIYALYSDSFTDNQNKLVIGKSASMIYETYEERDRMLFDEKLNKFFLILLFVIIYIAYFIISNFIL